jgi:DNA repair protein RecN (Recombination protein N)
VFDEVDTGIGGAVADAVGERLGRLATGSQILVVTHSPQVAARAESHAKVEKTAPTTAGVAEDPQESLATVVRPLDLVERREEIARMLSGAAVTDAARAAADSLMAHHPAPPGKRKGGRGTTGKSARPAHSPIPIPTRMSAI